jgi:hypothetical protein
VTYLPNRPEQTILSPHTADGTLTSAVYRAADGTLTFRYGIDLEAIGGPTDPEVPCDEANCLTVRNFTGFSTESTAFSVPPWR